MRLNFLVKNEKLILELPIIKIRPNNSQPRKQCREEELQSLARSITENGVLQPLTVRKISQTEYELVTGERRLRAAALAGLHRVPCIVIRCTDKESAVYALLENLQRADLGIFEEARGISRLIRRYGLTQEQAAQRLGKSRSAVANLLRMLNLPKEVADMVVAGELSEGHARALLGAEDPECIIALANKVVDNNLNVRQTETLVKAMKEEKPPKEEPLYRCAELSLVEEAARMRFGTKVTINGNEKRGRITLHYASAEDLERIYEFLRIREEE